MDIALAQLELTAGDVSTNRQRACQAIVQAAADGADLVVLPEAFSVGYFAFDAYTAAAEPITGPTLSKIATTAADADIAVLAGTIIEDLAATTTVSTPADEGLANTAVLFDASGNRRLVYRKQHLFGYDSAEANLLVPGKQLDVATLDGLTIGVTTCYDLRFPELYRSLVDQGAVLTLVPAAWPYPRVEHWTLLPQARAVENLMYVAAVNAAGQIGDSSLVGRSALIDPWGVRVASAGPTADLVTASVDPTRVAAVRDEFPALDDRRQ